MGTRDTNLSPFCAKLCILFCYTIVVNVHNSLCKYLKKIGRKIYVKNVHFTST